MKQLSTFVDNFFTGLLVVSCALLIGYHIITPELIVSIGQRIEGGSWVLQTAMTWVNRLGVVAALVGVGYLLYNPAKQVAGVGQVTVKLVD